MVIKSSTQHPYAKRSTMDANDDDEALVVAKSRQLANNALASPSSSFSSRHKRAGSSVAPIDKYEPLPQSFERNFFHQHPAPQSTTTTTAERVRSPVLDKYEPLPQVFFSEQERQKPLLQYAAAEVTTMAAREAPAAAKQPPAPESVRYFSSYQRSGSYRSPFRRNRTNGSTRNSRLEAVLRHDEDLFRTTSGQGQLDISGPSTARTSVSRSKAGFTRSISSPGSPLRRISSPESPLRRRRRSSELTRLKRSGVDQGEDPLPLIRIVGGNDSGIELLALEEMKTSEHPMRQSKTTPRLLRTGSDVQQQQQQESSSRQRQQRATFRDRFIRSPRKLRSGANWDEAAAETKQQDTPTDQVAPPTKRATTPTSSRRRCRSSSPTRHWRERLQRAPSLISEKPAEQWSASRSEIGARQQKLLLATRLLLCAKPKMEDHNIITATEQLSPSEIRPMSPQTSEGKQEAPVVPSTSTGPLNPLFSCPVTLEQPLQRLGRGRTFSPVQSTNSSLQSPGNATWPPQAPSRAANHGLLLSHLSPNPWSKERSAASAAAVVRSANTTISTSGGGGTANPHSTSGAGGTTANPTTGAGSAGRHSRPQSPAVEEEKATEPPAKAPRGRRQRGEQQPPPPDLIDTALFFPRSVSDLTIKPTDFPVPPANSNNNNLVTAAAMAAAACGDPCLHPGEGFRTFYDHHQQKHQPPSLVDVSPHLPWQQPAEEEEFDHAQIFDSLTRNLEKVQQEVRMRTTTTATTTPAPRRRSQRRGTQQQ